MTHSVLKKMPTNCDVTVSSHQELLSGTNVTRTVTVQVLSLMPTACDVTASSQLEMFLNSTGSHKSCSTDTPGVLYTAISALLYSDLLCFIYQGLFCHDQLSSGNFFAFCNL